MTRARTIASASIALAGLASGALLPLAACTSFGGVDDTEEAGRDASALPPPVLGDGGVLDGQPPDADAVATPCGTRRVMALPKINGVQRYLGDIFVSDATSIYKCSVKGCAGAPVAVVTGQRNIRSLSVGGGFVFWVSDDNTGDANGPAVLRRMDTAGGAPITLRTPANTTLFQVQVSQSAAKQLTFFSSHLYGANIDAIDLSTPTTIVTYYQPQETGLTSVDERILFYHQSYGIGGAPAGPRICPVRTNCEYQDPVVQVDVPVAVMHADATDLYLAVDKKVYRAGLAKPDGGAPKLGAPLADFGASINYIDANGAMLHVVTTSNTGEGRVLFLPKSGGAPSACDLTFAAPTAVTTDDAALYVADSEGVLAVGRRK